MRGAARRENRRREWQINLAYDSAAFNGAAFNGNLEKMRKYLPKSDAPQKNASGQALAFFHALKASGSAITITRLH